MNYGTVRANGWILPLKKKYTVRDCNNVLTDSLFGKYGKKSLTKREAGFIVVCSAIFHGVEYSEGVNRFRQSDREYRIL